MGWTHHLSATGDLIRKERCMKELSLGNGVSCVTTRATWAANPKPRNGSEARWAEDRFGRQKRTAHNSASGRIRWRKDLFGDRWPGQATNTWRMSKLAHTRTYELSRIKEKNNRLKQDPRINLALKAKQITIDLQRSLPSLPHFWMELKTRYWLTSTLGNLKWNWKVARSPIHSRVLYIGPSKRLNDYYAPRA
jgi:hypothetical protein